MGMFRESWYTKGDNNSINVCRDMSGAHYSLIVSKEARGEFEHTCKQARKLSTDASQ